MAKGRPVKQYHIDHYNGTMFIDNLENILNDKYKQGWKYVAIIRIKVNEYNILYEKSIT